jgi:ABC-2 type transport system permease protein
VNAAWAIAVQEVRRYLRGKIPLFTTLVMPVALVLVIGVTFGRGAGEVGVGVLDEDGSEVSAAFTAALDTSALVVTRYVDADAMARDIRLGFLTAGVRVPEGFAGALERGEAVAVEMTLDQGSTDGPVVASAIEAATGRFAAAPSAVAVGAAVLRGGEETRGLLADVAGRVATEMPPIAVETSVVGTVPAESSAFARATYTQLALFIFLNGMLAGIPLVESRRLGVSRRMLSTPTGIGPHILGVGLGRWFLGLLQAALLLGLGVLAFGVDIGSWPAALTLTLLWCALAAAVGMILGAIGRTPEQVVAWSVPLGIGLAMLGGCMWPLALTPPVMQVLGHATPHAWVVDAWAAVVDDGARLGDIVPELAVLTGVTLGLGALAVVLLRRSLAR